MHMLDPFSPSFAILAAMYTHSVVSENAEFGIMDFGGLHLFFGLSHKLFDYIFEIFIQQKNSEYILKYFL